MPCASIPTQGVHAFARVPALCELCDVVHTRMSTNVLRSRVLGNLAHETKQKSSWPAAMRAPSRIAPRAD